MTDHFIQPLPEDASSTSPSDIRTESDSNFLARCKPQLEDLEFIRLAKLKVYKFRKKISIPLGVVLTPICGAIDFWILALQRGSDSSGAGITVFMLGALFFWVTQPKRDYTKQYKQIILPEIARLFGPFTFDVKGKIDMLKMGPSKIIPYHNKYRSEDYFKGEYKGIDIEFSEINLKKIRRRGKRTRYVSVFRGLAIILETKHKRFYGHTIIERNAGKFSEWLKEKSNKLERAEMVDPEFEQAFDAYTSDQVEARYLIDPTMIESLKNLYSEYNGRGMSAAFYDNKMLILIKSHHNHFEPAGLNVPATSSESIISMKKEIGQILSIIDKLSLYDPDELHKENAASITTT